MVCNNRNHTFTNGRHDPICSVVDLGNHLATVRVFATTFNDHLKDRFTTFNDGVFGFYMCGFDNARFVSDCMKMLNELKDLIEFRVEKLCCNYDMELYNRLKLLINDYYITLDNIKDFNLSEIKVILKDLIKVLLEFYDIELLESDEDDSDYIESESDDSSITLSDNDQSYLR